MAKAVKKVEAALTEEQLLILEGAELREKLEPYRVLEKRYDEVRKALVALHKAGLESGRNEPMTAPGISISWRQVDKPEYTVPARTEYHIQFNKMVPPK